MDRMENGWRMDEAGNCEGERHVCGAGLPSLGATGILELALLETASD